MNIFVKLVYFSIMLNFASGIMIASIPALAVPTNTGGIFYDGEYTKELNRSLDLDIDPSSPLEDASDADRRLLDLTGIGHITKFLRAIPRYVYGFPRMLNNVFGNYLPSEVRTIFFGTFGVFNLIITFGYAFLILYLWTGRKVVD